MKWAAAVELAVVVATSVVDEKLNLKPAVRLQRLGWKDNSDATAVGKKGDLLKDKFVKSGAVSHGKNEPRPEGLQKTTPAILMDEKLRMTPVVRLENLRLKGASDGNIDSTGTEKNDEPSSLKRKDGREDMPSPKRPRSSSDQPSTSHGENAQLPSLVRKYSGHWYSTIGINLEISQDFAAKFGFTILASGESKSTGWMRMERAPLESYECFELTDYAISDEKVFDWASRMAGYRFSAGPRLVDIDSPSGSGVEIFIGGEMVKLECMSGTLHL
ncbi:hypothetical protein FOZ63_019363 [Perkinsus olseni]|uniref:Uncharacterized protein n=1 Tax=Perkinsus olseni TaxID=32597 RepID=A0A7J6T0U9_PEROL|nr:hypothetical protein FOZ63_019363 [Perkinsus olseni]